MTKTQANDHPMLGNRFRILKDVGAGATSRVLQAEDLVLGRTVAIKLPRHGLLKEKPFLKKMFLKEAKYLASLEHPNIMPLYDYYESSDGPVLIMRHVLGTLHHANRKKTLPSQLVGELAGQVAASLDFCISQGIAHRDVKPDNILLDDNSHAYLTDFGLAAHINDDSKWEEVIGTPPFVSPDLFLDQKFNQGSLQRERVDQFSFGVLLYQLLTGCLPFDRKSQSKYPPGWESCTALRLMKRERLTPCAERNPHIPIAVDDVLSQMLSVDPECRFSSNIEAAKSLTDALEGRSAKTIRAFLCYSHQDDELAASLVMKLKDLGISVWWDQHIIHGTDWDDQIEEAMLASEVILVLLSQQSILASEPKREWKYWLEYIKKPVIPVVIGDCRLPYRLSSLQRIEIRNGSAEELAAELHSAIYRATGQHARKKTDSSASGAHEQKNSESTPLDAFEQSAPLDDPPVVLQTLLPCVLESVADITRIPDQYRLDRSILQRYLSALPQLA